ncbi:RNA polymerase II transcriptional coactivator KELP-like [Macadamia integrifolia]|uniref:RNA polymerase II transcriptional coactivator KELP-like n=1 Tax=Macadamia integrifolia TaxID=60698 RepID=UPI001C4F5B35|nr:RNA polymerase II transcriptional coactivator KELP-like [Macadamia integrifolia]
MEPETQHEVEETVLEVLRNSDMNEMTESKVRAMAAEKLGIDLSGSGPKRFVRKVVESFLLSKEQDGQQAEAVAAADEENKEIEENEEEEEDEGGEGKRKPIISKKEYDDEGDLIICRLSNKRRVTIQDFRGKTLVSIREYYERDGKELPSSKGISLTAEQWSAFRKAMPGVEEAINKMESRLR